MSVIKQKIVYIPEHLGHTGKVCQTEDILTEILYPVQLSWSQKMSPYCRSITLRVLLLS